MKASQFLPVIVRTLETTARDHSGSAKELGAHLVSRMVDVEEMWDAVASEGLVLAIPPAPQGLRGPDLPPPAPATPVDLSERIGAPPRAYTVEELRAYYTDALPLTLPVQIAGQDAPLQLNRTMLGRPSALGGTLEIRYTAPGCDPESQSVRMIVTTPRPNQELIPDIEAGARSTYHGKPVAPILPRIPAHGGTLSETMAGATSVDTDAEENAGDLAAWQKAIGSERLVH